MTRRPELSEQDFVREYLEPQRPVILPSAMQNWPAVEKWSIDFLRQEFGDLEVPVYSSKPATGKSHQHAPELSLPLGKYLSMLEAGEDDLRVFFYNIFAERSAVTR